MAFIFISEYETLAENSLGQKVQAGQEPAVATQRVAIGAGSVQSAVWSPTTKFVRINTDAVCSILFGANPTASATSPRMSANATEFFGVVPGQRVAVITNT